MLNAQTLAAKAQHSLSGTDLIGLGLLFIAACFAAVIFKRTASGADRTGPFVAYMLVTAAAGIALLFKPAM